MYMHVQMYFLSPNNTYSFHIVVKFHHTHPEMKTNEIKNIYLQIFETKPFFVKVMLRHRDNNLRGGGRHLMRKKCCQSLVIRYLQTHPIPSGPKWTGTKGILLWCEFRWDDSFQQIANQRHLGQPTKWQINAHETWMEFYLSHFMKECCKVAVYES